MTTGLSSDDHVPTAELATNRPASTSRTCVIIGAGRAGGSFHHALGDAGWLSRLLDRDDDPSGSAAEADVVLLAVPDHIIAEVAASISPGRAVVAHCAGSQTLERLAPHAQVGSIHPLMSLPDPRTGARRLADGCTFAIDGDPLMAEMVEVLGGTAIFVPDDRRPLYHATACVAANHLTALCHQVQAMAQDLDVAPEAFWQLMQTTLENVIDVGPVAALTGPAARADWQTVQGHMNELSGDDRMLYLQLSRRAAAMVGNTWPEDLTT